MHATNAAYPLTLLQAQSELDWLIGSPTNEEIAARTDEEWAVIDDAVGEWLAASPPNDPDIVLTRRVRWAAFTDWLASHFRPDPYLASCSACGDDVVRWRTEAPAPCLCPDCLAARLRKAFPGVARLWNSNREE